MHALTLGTNFIFAVLWTMVLNWLCSIGMKTVSWILVLLPYLMLFLSAGFVMDMMHTKEGFYQSLSVGKKEGFICPPSLPIECNGGCALNQHACTDKRSPKRK